MPNKVHFNLPWTFVHDRMGVYVVAADVNGNILYEHLNKYDDEIQLKIHIGVIERKDSRITTSTKIKLFVDNRQLPENSRILGRMPIIANAENYKLFHPMSPLLIPVCLSLYFSVSLSLSLSLAHSFISSDCSSAVSAEGAQRGCIITN